MSLPKQIWKSSRFHKGISNFLEETKPSLDSDWAYQIKQDDLGLVYLLYHFSKPTKEGGEPGYIVVARVNCYDLVKKEMLPPEEDKVIVFRFKTLDELLCQKNQS